MPSLIERVTARPLPRHVAVIMDGNGRWATSRNLPRTAGHQAGAQAAERLIRFVGRKVGLSHLTLYAFSTENWTRPESEVRFLMDLLEQFIREKLAEFVREGVRVVVSGETAALAPPLRETVEHAIASTATNNQLVLNVALNYGSRQEIVRACRQLAAACADGALNPAAIDPDRLAAALYTADLPDPDLVIRTSGEMRLSNFLLWQSAYAELYFTETLWPDFTPAEFLKAVAAFQDRERRYGAVKEGV